MSTILNFLKFGIPFVDEKTIPNKSLLSNKFDGKFDEKFDDVNSP